MVEWKKLGNLCEIKTGKGITQKDCTVDGVYPVISGGQCPMGMYSQYNREADTITISRVGAYAGFVSFIKNRFYLNDKCFSIIPFKESLIINKFLFDVLKNQEEGIKKLQSEGGVPTINTKKLSALDIPIPPLSEQNRIVGILDTFTESIENIKKQITERKKQYEHYRDQLLDLEGKPGVEMMSMGELFTFKNGLNKGKEFFGSGKPIIMFSNVFNSRYLKSSMITNRVDITEKEMERIDAKIGDVFFTRTSETREDVGYSSVLLEDIGECTFAGFLIRARPLTDKLIPSYCKYCFSSPIIRCSIIGNSSFTTRASLTGSGLGKIDLPIPPLSQQSRIVSILDTFEASIANLEQQLTHRQKQYEYYRNMLLTFDE